MGPTPHSLHDLTDYGTADYKIARPGEVADRGFLVSIRNEGPVSSTLFSFAAIPNVPYRAKNDLGTNPSNCTVTTLLQNLAGVLGSAKLHIHRHNIRLSVIGTEQVRLLYPVALTNCLVYSL